MLKNFKLRAKTRQKTKKGRHGKRDLASLLHLRLTSGNNSFELLHTEDPLILFVKKFSGILALMAP